MHAWRRIYHPKNFGFVWEGFDTLIKEGRFKASIEVHNELKKKDDELFAWCKESMFVEIDDDTQAIVAKIMRDHSGSPAFRNPSSYRARSSARR